VTRRVALALATLAIATLGIALACGSNRIMVATIVESDAALPCELADAGDAADPCPTGTFCSRTSCGSKGGTCEAIGADACTISGYECGCDGITYYNSCVRQAARMSRSAQAACGAGYEMGIPPQLCLPADLTGVGAKDCPYCATVFLYPSPLMPTDEAGADIEMACKKVRMNATGFATGICWALPDSLPDAGSRSVEAPCEPSCIDDWSAIRDGGAYFLCSDAAAF
jgi:hypothetical protein